MVNGNFFEVSAIFERHPLSIDRGCRFRAAFFARWHVNDAPKRSTVGYQRTVTCSITGNRSRQPRHRPNREKNGHAQAMWPTAERCCTAERGKRRPLARGRTERNARRCSGASTEQQWVAHDAMATARSKARSGLDQMVIFPSTSCSLRRASARLAFARSST